MFILSYIALSLWILFSFIAILIYSIALMVGLAAGAPGAAMYALAGLLLSGFIVYAAYHNILDLGRCAELMNK